MNKFKIAIVILICSIGFFAACEKDDICVDDDTPLLIIRFYDAENPTELKVVPSLRIIGIGNGETLGTFTDRTSTLDSIGIPLKTTDTTTQFSFITNSEDDDSGDETGTIDNVEFLYTLSEIFKSRACGYIVNYDELNTDTTSNTTNWIQSIEIIKTSVTIEEELTAHVKIFH